MLDGLPKYLNGFRRLMDEHSLCNRCSSGSPSSKGGIPNPLKTHSPFCSICFARRGTRCCRLARRVTTRGRAPSESGVAVSVYHAVGKITYGLTSDFLGRPLVEKEYFDLAPGYPRREFFGPLKGTRELNGLTFVTSKLLHLRMRVSVQWPKVQYGRRFGRMCSNFSDGRSS